MPELRFAITQQQKSVTDSHLYRDNWLRHCYTGSIGWRITSPVIIYCTYLAAQRSGQIISPDYYMLLILLIQHR